MNKPRPRGDWWSARRYRGGGAAPTGICPAIGGCPPVCGSPSPEAMGGGLPGSITLGAPSLHARVYTGTDRQIMARGSPKQVCRFVGVAAMDGRWGIATTTLLPLKKQNQLLFF